MDDLLSVQAVGSDFHGFDEEDVQEIGKYMEVRQKSTVHLRACTRFRTAGCIRKHTHPSMRASASAALFTALAAHLPASSFYQVTPFKAQDEILCKGEAASWVGVILKGELEVRISDSYSVNLQRGSIIGGLSYFTPGGREHRPLAARFCGAAAHWPPANLTTLSTIPSRDSTGPIYLTKSPAFSTCGLLSCRRGGAIRRCVRCL